MHVPTKQISALSSQETEALFRFRHFAVWPTYRKRIVEGNTRLVHLIVTRDYLEQIKNYSWMDANDLVHEGIIGLIRAVDHYDPLAPTTFAQYAPTVVRNAIYQFVFKNSHQLSHSQHTMKLVQKIVRPTTQFTASYGRSPSLEELEQISGLSQRTLISMSRLSTKWVPYTECDESDDCDDGTYHKVPGDMVLSDDPVYASDPTVSDALRELILQQTRRTIAYMLTCLTRQELHVVQHHFGLGSREAQSLACIARQLGVTRQRISQVYHNALGKLTEYLKFKRLHSEVRELIAS